MRTWTIGLVVAVLLIALAPIAAADKPQDLIVGKWNLMAADKDAPEVTIEFAKDGKLHLILSKNGKEQKRFEGTYKFIDDANLEVILERDGKKDTEKSKVKVTKDELMITGADGQ